MQAVSKLTASVCDTLCNIIGLVHKIACLFMSVHEPSMVLLCSPGEQLCMEVTVNDYIILQPLSTHTLLLSHLLEPCVVLTAAVAQLR